MIAVVLVLLCAALLFNTVLSLHVIAAVATLFFGLVVALRLIACINLIAQVPIRLLRRGTTPGPDDDLPVYTLLVPLYREANVIEGLTRALMALEYPADKLDIKLVFEAIDRDSVNQARALKLPSQFEILIVPDALPRTKPKALNFALQLARGDFVVVYDAEDRPHPRQLRDALAAFVAGPPNLACVQARLSIYNARENWLTNGIR